MRVAWTRGRPTSSAGLCARAGAAEAGDELVQEGLRALRAVDLRGGGPGLAFGGALLGLRADLQPRLARRLVPVGDHRDPVARALLPVPADVEVALVALPAGRNDAVRLLGHAEVQRRRAHEPL